MASIRRPYIGPVILADVPEDSRAVTEETFGPTVTVTRVRGNWRRADESGPSVLTKCCHDLDWLRYIVGRPRSRVSSQGGLHHFTAANRPAGAADRCLDCAVEPGCPYSAPGSTSASWTTPSGSPGRWRSSPPT